MGSPKRFLLRYFTVLLLGSNCLVKTEDTTTNSDPQILTFLDEDTNETRVVDLTAAPDNSIVEKSTQCTTNKYLLYTQSNPNEPQVLIFNDSGSITSSNFNASDLTVVSIHGWLGDGQNDFNQAVKNATLSKTKANYIILDWSAVSKSDYITASNGVPGTGNCLGQFLVFLCATTGASYSNILVVGFSLGAHVGGVASNYAKTQGGNIPRIVGLDPAGPLFGESNENRLKPGDAINVETIHTDMGGFGTRLISGDVDFYPNRGASQPGCVPIISIVTFCDHKRAWQLFVVTIIFDNLIGRKCTDETLSSCNGDSLNMGTLDLQKTGNGQYLLFTTGTYPYTQVNSLSL